MTARGHRALGSHSAALLLILSALVGCDTRATGDVEPKASPTLGNQALPTATPTSPAQRVLDEARRYTNSVLHLTLTASEAVFSSESRAQVVMLDGDSVVAALTLMNTRGEWQVVRTEPGTPGLRIDQARADSASSHVTAQGRTAAAGETVVVVIQDTAGRIFKRQQTTSGADSKWTATVGPITATAPLMVLVTVGTVEGPMAVAATLIYS